jgi:hypothetical protein
MNQPANKPSIAKMLSQIGQHVTVSNAHQVSFKIRGRSFDYNTDQRVFSEITAGVHTPVNAAEVRKAVEIAVEVNAVFQAAPYLAPTAA